MQAGSVAAACLAAALAGCATVSTQPATPAPIATAFELSGRISVRQGDKLDIAKLRWTHASAGDLWVLSSPLGNEVARIERTGDAVILSRAGEAPLASPSFAALSQEMLGVALDPDELSRWLQGIAAPASDGWQVEIEERAPDGTVRRMTAIRADTVVKLAVDSFRRNPQ